MENLTALGKVSRSDAQDLTTHFGDEIQAARDHDEVLIGRALACVRQRGGTAGVLEGHATVSAHGVSHFTGGHGPR